MGTSYQKSIHQFSDISVSTPKEDSSVITTKNQYKTYLNQTIESKPKCIIYVEEISKIEENFKGKNSHFNIKLINKKGIHLKIEDSSIRKNWVEALRKLSFFYKKKRIGDFNKGRHYKDNLDIQIFNKIMEEKESNFFYF